MGAAVNCSYCKFWRVLRIQPKSGKALIGFCHRYPPPIATHHEIKPDCQPLTKEVDWCGELKPLKQGGAL